MSRGFISVPKAGTQRRLAHDILRARGIVRLSEFRAAGITAATIGRMRRDGEVVHLARGLYQLPDAPLDANHSLAEAAKRVPKGVVCLVSALAFHELTDQIPAAVWMAISTKSWGPKGGMPAVRIVRFTEAFLAEAVVTERIEGVPVKIFGVAKTIADCFRHRRTVGQAVALEGLREALRQRKATPAEIARHAADGRVAGVVRPYLEALTANG
ncbi:MAG: type IV toxin-antitoxin system AbiEi family antitoxin domain-containing protein [Bryobacterales bacterium]|nr:type IV toxin-antitoxin system AbiEi family antitoxin domain-containing protein [Bryobacterales bacterium]